MQNMTDSEIEAMWPTDPRAASFIPESSRVLYQEVKRCRAEMAAKDAQIATLKKEASQRESHYKSLGEWGDYHQRHVR